VVGLDPLAASEQAQHAALHRALIERVRPALSMINSKEQNASLSCVVDCAAVIAPPTLHIVSDPLLQYAASKSISKFNQHLKSAEESSIRDVDCASSSGPQSTADSAPPRKRARRQTCSPCGNSINFIANLCAPCSTTSIASSKRVVPCQGGSVEVTIAHTGALQGAVKRHVGEPEAASRISRRSLMALFVDVVAECLRMEVAKREVLEGESSGELGRLIDLLREVDAKTSTNKDHHSIDPAIGGAVTEWWMPILYSQPYHWWKQHCSAQYVGKRRIFLASSPFNDWLCDDPEAGSGMTCLQHVNEI
jgi:hypothetical protein